MFVPSPLRVSSEGHQRVAFSSLSEPRQHAAGVSVQVAAETVSLEGLLSKSSPKAPVKPVGGLSGAKAEVLAQVAVTLSRFLSREAILLRA